MTNSVRALSVALLLMAWHLTSACDCKPFLSVEESLRSADLVVTGTILNADYGKQLTQSQEYLDTLTRRNERLYFALLRVNEYLIIVNEAFKGAVVGDTMIVRTALDPVTDCGLRMTAGEKHILYATKLSPGDNYYDREKRVLFTTSACTRTRPYSRSESRAIGKQVAR